MKRIHGVDPLKVRSSESTEEESDSEVEARLVLKKSQSLRRPPPAIIVLSKPCVTIGRNYNVDCCVVSEAISRLHCEIKLCSGPSEEWELIDRSGNGVFINETRIIKGVGHQLHDGDVVNFASVDDPVVSYEFKAKMIGKRSPDAKSKRPRPEILPTEPEPTQSTSLVIEAAKEPVKSLERGTGTPERLELWQKNKDLAVELQKMKDKMNQQEILLRQQWECEQEEKKKAENARAEALVTEEITEKEKWQQMLDELSAKHTTAQEEKNQLAERLKSMSDDKSKEDEIQKDKAKLEAELRNKDSECSAMKHQLDDLTSRIEESAALAIKLRDDVIKNVNETMETELQCSICSELFVKAATLNCSHSYCSSCINEWKQKKAECPICRQKIVSITPSLVLDNFIERIVNTLNTSLKERRKELLEERSKQPAQNVARNSVIVIPDTTTQRQGAARRHGHRQPRRRPNRGMPARATVQVPAGAIFQIRQAVPLRGTADSRRGTASPQRATAPMRRTAAPPLRSLLEIPSIAFNNPPVLGRFPVPAGVQPIEISSQSDEDEVEVASPFGYYGGHGPCYRCGGNGHWANGCPY